MTLRRKIPIVLAVFWTVVFSLQVWLMQASGFSESLLQSDESIEVLDTPEMTQFTPTAHTARAALLFYPGAVVDPDAYAPIAHTMAEAGYRVVVVKVPYRVAFFQSQQDEVTTRTMAVLDQDNGQHRWIIGGHSKGGAMAAAFARDHAERVDGLLLVGTSHPRRDDLSHLQINVMKVYASEDGLASEPEVDEFADLLPTTTRWVRIDGGNHTQFGYYRWQFGDEKATLSHEAQQKALVTAMLEQLGQVTVAGL